jgi:hypothetical protein
VVLTESVTTVLVHLMNLSMKSMVKLIVHHVLPVVLLVVITLPIVLLAHLINTYKLPIIPVNVMLVLIC